jgi:hypothetical protein
LCPPFSDNCGPQGQHALVNPVFGRTRNVARAVSAAPESTHPTVLDLPSQCVGDGFRRAPLNAETLVANSIDQLGDGGRTLVRQVESEHVAQLDTSKARQIHRRNIAHSYDTEHGCRCEAGTSGATSRSDGCDWLGQSRSDSAPLLAWIGRRVAQQHLDAYVIGTGRTMLGDPTQDCLLVTPRDDRVEEAIADLRQIVFGEA